ncbi:hypothetical protein [Thioalkalivibrio sp.]|uniref:hypothetical protein n=1 Tax=Thioalkalivibrio sp. TaxID=2093813 RepID=UPI00356AD5B8
MNCATLRRGRRKAAGRRIAAVAGIALVLMTLGQGSAGCAVARVSGPAERPADTATPPVPLTGHTRIIRYPDGHALISHDSYGTDITVQRAPGSLGPEGHALGPEGFDRRHLNPDTGMRLVPPPVHHPDRPDPSLRDEYRRRMLERLDARP